MMTLSWQLTLAALVLVPFFVIPARLMGRRLAALTHEQMTVNADLGTRMNERFNVAGALLVKLFGKPSTEDAEYGERAGRVRDIGVTIALNRSLVFVALTMIACPRDGAGLRRRRRHGRRRDAHGRHPPGAGGPARPPLRAAHRLSNVRVDVMTALVCFERVFEVLDLSPSWPRPRAPGRSRPGPSGSTFDDVSFPYPRADEVSLASLESAASGDRRAGGPVLRDVSFSVEPGSDRRARRSQRRRQDHHHLARRPALRPLERLHPGRRPRRA